MGIELKKIEEGVEIKIGIVRLQLSMKEAKAVMTVLQVALGVEADDEIRQLKERKTAKERRERLRVQRKVDDIK